FLREVQLRVASGGDGRRDRVLAVDEPQLRARGGCPLPAFEYGSGHTDPGDARCADVRVALAVGRGNGVGTPSLSRRQESAGAAATDARRGLDGRRVPGPDR